MATCSISGLVPEEPVVSLKSGHLFEKRLIVKHVEACGLCPVTQAPLTLDDLLPIKTTAPVTKPRPPTATSFPSLLQMLQSEWDSMALETFTMRQKLNALKQELAHAAYEQDAAKRVIARLIAERDSALEQLKNVDQNISRAYHTSKASGAQFENEGKTAEAASSDSMTDGQRQLRVVPEDVIARMKVGQERVGGANRTGTVKQRQALVQSQDKLSAISSDTTDKVTQEESTTAFVIGSLSESKPASVAFAGSESGDVFVYSLLPENKLTRATRLSVGKSAVTAFAAHASVPGVVFVGTSDGVVRAIKITNASDVESGSTNEIAIEVSGEMRSPIKAGAVTSLSVHPAGDIAVASFENGSWGIFDSLKGSCVLSVPASDSVLDGIVRLALHPDGNLVGVVSNKSGSLNIYDTVTQTLLCTINVCADVEGAGVEAVAFSENGLSCYTADSTGSVKLWQLRRPDQPPKAIGRLPEGSFGSLSIDISGSYVIATTDRAFTVFAAKNLASVVSKETNGDEGAVSFAGISNEARSIVSAIGSAIQLFVCPDM